MAFEPTTKPLGRVLERTIIWVFASAVAGCLSALGGFWWLLEGQTLWQGAFTLLVITALAFSRVPAEGRKWFKRKEVVYFFLPVWGANIVGFILGLGKIT